MDAKTFKLRNYLVVFSILIISGCVATAERITELQPQAIKKDSNVGVVWISQCVRSPGCKETGEASKLGEFDDDGNSGLLFIAMANSAHKALINALAEVSADPIVESSFLNPVAKALEDKGAVASVSKSFLDQGDLSKTGKHSVLRLRETLKELHPESSTIYQAMGFDYPYDLSAIASELDSNTLVVLHVQEFGVRRSFGPFAVPLARPYGLALVRTFVWDVATKSTLYSDFGIAEAYVGSDWRDDDWAQITTATNTALELAIDRATKPLIDSINSQ